MTRSGMCWRLSSYWSRWPWRGASASSATHSVAVRNATRCPARQARMPKAIERWLLPVPGGPSRTTFSLPARKSSWPRCKTAVRLIERWKAKSNSSSVFRAGEASGLDAGLAAVAVAAVGLGLEQRGGEVLIGPLLGASAIGELGQRPGRRGRLELAEQVREFAAGAHAISAS